jgi:uncharacterized integral membrane protein (TIGR00697 family)
MTRLLPGILAMAAIVVASNILVQHIIAGGWLTWGAFTYPFAFLVTDVMNRVYGSSAARRVIFAGFIVGVICSLIGTQIIGEFGPLVTWRIALGSGVAFLVAQLIDVVIFSRLRDAAWWKAPLTSSVFGSAIDTAIFFTVAFAGALSFIEPGNDVSWANEPRAIFGIGPVLPYWIGLGLADYTVKLLIALVALVPFRVIVTKLSSGELQKTS